MHTSVCNCEADGGAKNGTNGAGGSSKRSDGIGGGSSSGGGTLYSFILCRRDSCE